METLIPRKYCIGQNVATKSGIQGKVIGSAIYGVVDNKVTKFTHVVYRIKIQGRARTLYRKECDIGVNNVHCIQR